MGVYLNGDLVRLILMVEVICIVVFSDAWVPSQ